MAKIVTFKKVKFCFELDLKKKKMQNWLDLNGANFEFLLKLSRQNES